MQCQSSCLHVSTWGTNNFNCRLLVAKTLLSFNIYFWIRCSIFITTLSLYKMWQWQLMSYVCLGVHLGVVSNRMGAWMNKCDEFTICVVSAWMDAQMDTSDVFIICVVSARMGAWMDKSHEFTICVISARMGAQMDTSDVLIISGFTMENPAIVTSQKTYFVYGKNTIYTYNNW